MTTRFEELAAERSSILDQIEALSVRVNAWTTPTVPAENAAAVEALQARLVEVDREQRQIARAEAYRPDNAQAMTGCYNARLLAANLPPLDSLDEEE